MDGWLYGDSWLDEGANGASIHLHSENIEDALQFRIAKESYFESALSLGVFEPNAGAEAFAQAVFEIGEVSVAGRELDGRFGRHTIVAHLQPSHQILGLADVQAFVQDAIGSKLLLFLSFQA